MSYNKKFMSQTLLLLFLILNLVQGLFNTIEHQETEHKMNIREQIKYHGYPVLTYTITTVDGYKLGVHRIPGPYIGN